jgi:predicted ester cyclase
VRVLTAFNKSLVKRFIGEVWNAGNGDVDRFIHPEYIVPGIGQGPDAVMRNVAQYRAAFPDLRWTVKAMVAEGDLVAVRLLFRGTHQGEFAGVAATGRRVEFQEMVFWRIVDRQLHSIWSQADGPGLRKQLGIIPPGL